MQTVKILCGGYGHNVGGRVQLVSRGGTVEVDEAEASRLVALGVASLVVTTPSAPVESPPPSENTSETKDSPDGFLEAHLDRDQLLSMTNAQLKQLAEDMGLDPGKCRKKADYIDLITEATVYVEDDEVDDGELPPDLTAEDPV